MLTDIILKINPLQSHAGNAAIQAVIFEVILIVLVPLVGLLVEGVIVNGIRVIIRKLLGWKIEFVFSNYLLFPGTMIHELSHALFAFITGAKITELALFKPNGNSLGHVCFVPRGIFILRAFQEGFSACAPVIVGAALSVLTVLKIFPALTQTWQQGIAIYMLVAIVFHMNMSPADIKCYFRGMALIALIALPFCFWYFV